MTHIADRLVAGLRAKRTPLCVGLDPRFESLPAAIRKDHSDRAIAYGVFCLHVLEIVAPLVAVVKPQSAFFEECGPSGVGALQFVIEEAKKRGLITILDAKRGDIASTAKAYAEAAFTALNADALTVNPYLGRDAVEPFIEAARNSQRGLFVLTRTSNPGSGQFQNLLCDGKPLYRHVADAVGTWNSENLGECGLGDVGAVVGATHPAELAELRALLPNVWFLVPGFGAQGGTPNDVKPALRADGLGAIVNSSRGVTFSFAPDNPRWEAVIETATREAIAALPKV